LLGKIIGVGNSWINIDEDLLWNLWVYFGDPEIENRYQPFS
jgi:hypothetical protein